MNKSSKPLIVKFMILLVLLTAIVLANVGIRFKNEELLRSKTELIKLKNDMRTSKVKLIADYQDLTSETRIISLAENQLGMIKQDRASIIINIDKNLVESLVKELSGRYE